MKTAIIDNGIDNTTLSRYSSSSISLMVSGGELIPWTPPPEITHGGVCASVFAKQAGVLPDVSICLSRDATHRSNVTDLAAALKWCADNGICLISLSMGTTQPKDCSLLQEAVENLQGSDTLLVAAASNDNRLTFPAALDFCIGVCDAADSPLDKGCFTYLKHPFDGINVATSPVFMPELQVFGSNSLSAAFIAGALYKAFKEQLNPERAHSWLSQHAQRISAGWEQSYLLRKTRYAKEYEGILIACCGVSPEQTETYMEELQMHIVKDGYTCVILGRSIKNNPSQHRFSLVGSPLLPEQSLQLAASLCRPGIILFDTEKLACLADKIVHDGTVCTSTHISPPASLFEYTPPGDLWMQIKAQFGSN